MANRLLAGESASACGPHGKPAPTSEPAYVRLLYSGELQRRADQAVAELSECHVCPRECGADRLADKQAVCRTGRFAKVASYGPHRGEEDCLRGRRGSGTIFFAMCNLRCVFCQNSDISQRGYGAEVNAARLAGMMLELQAAGCHNINLVTPEHVVPQVLEALVSAAERGLRLPIVYNTSAYDSLHSLHLLDGVVDIYMPDFKLWTPQMCRRYLKAPDYGAVARRAIAEMHRQVGVLRFDERGLATRGVLVRHLLMPGLMDETRAIMRFLAERVSRDTYVNLMDQYYPANQVSSQDYSEINRPIARIECDEALAYARQVGLHRFDTRRSGWM